MILQKMDNFHELFSHNKRGGFWLSATVHSPNPLQAKIKNMKKFRRHKLQGIIILNFYIL
jgi:hypothetical protein